MAGKVAPAPSIAALVLNACCIAASDRAFRTFGEVNKRPVDGNTIDKL